MILSESERTFAAASLLCLNPCFNGWYSQSMETIKLQRVGRVLILVLMDDTLRVIQWFL